MYSNTPNPPAKFTATMYGKTVTIELDHSDFDLTELMEIFKGLTIASGFTNDSWNSVIKELSADIHDYEREDLKEKLNEWKVEDEEPVVRHAYGSWTEDSKDKAPFKEFGDEDDEVIDDVRKRYNKDSEGYESLDELDEEFFGKTEDYEGQFKDWENETPIEEERNIDAVEEMRKYAEDQLEREAERRMDIIGQNGNEGTHYGFDWDDTYEGETHAILTNINDSIALIKDRMVDIDLKMDNIDEQLGILNADVANIELGIAFPPPNEHILKAKDLYDRAVKASERDKEWRNDYVDMESGEVSNDGGFDGKALFAPYKRKPNQKVTEKVMGKWQTDNKTKEVVKLDKTKVRKGKIKDLKK
jgi:hypothetical protein